MNVIVIGGGPAGCAAAYTAGKHGHDVRLFEAADEPKRWVELPEAGHNDVTSAGADQFWPALEAFVDEGA